MQILRWGAVSIALGRFLKTSNGFDAPRKALFRAGDRGSGGAKRSAGAKHESHAKPSIYDFGYLSAPARFSSETKRSGAVSKEIQWFLRAEES